MLIIQEDITFAGVLTSHSLHRNLHSPAEPIARLVIIRLSED